MIRCKSVVLLFSIAVALLWSAPPAQADWIGNGVPLSTAAEMQWAHAVASDGTGGAI